MEMNASGGRAKAKKSEMEAGRMRLTCSNCDTQYEVEDQAIPDSGREVECSNCGHRWFQKGAAVLAVDEPVDPSRDEAAASPLPPNVRDVASGQETGVGTEEAPEPTSPKQQPSFGTRGSDTMPPASRRRETDRKALEILRQEAARETEVRRRVGSSTSGGDTLPDSEKIASSLQAISVRDDPARGRVRFRIGFALMLLVFALGVVLYEMAPRIGAAIPLTEQALGSYVDAVNRARIGLDDAWKPVRDAVSGFLEGA